MVPLHVDAQTVYQRLDQRYNVLDGSFGKERKQWLLPQAVMIMIQGGKSARFEIKAVDKPTPSFASTQIERIVKVRIVNVKLIWTYPYDGACTVFRIARLAFLSQEG